MDIGGAVIHDMPAGLGLQTDIPFGLAGIGYKRNSRTIGAREIVNDNLPVRMQKQGLINTVAYSLWLNDLRMFPYLAAFPPCLMRTSGLCPRDEVVTKLLTSPFPSLPRSRQG